MTSARDISEPILWHEGMMLAPQHFQELERRQAALLRHHLAAAAPFHWGVERLEIDRVALVSGLVRVLELEAVLPDGTVVAYDGRAGRPLELSLGVEAEAASRHPATVHLAVAAGHGISARGGELPRFEPAEGELIDDLAPDGEPVRIPRCRLLLSLVAVSQPGQRPPAKFVTVPLLRAQHAGEAFSLAPYAPPCLRTPEDSPLGRIAADVARRAREKALYLQERVAAGAGRDQRAEMQGLAAGLPALEALIGCGRAHPFALYLELARLVGLMSAFAGGAVPPVLARYDHDDPLAAFAELRDVALRMVDRVKQAWTPIPFALENGRFALKLEPAWRSEVLHVGVRAPAGMSDAEAVGWMQNSLIASRDRMQALWALRVSGAPRRVVEDPRDLDIAAPRGTLVFAIDADPEAVDPEGVLEIWNGEAGLGRLRPAEILLYVRA